MRTPSKKIQPTQRLTKSEANEIATLMVASMANHLEAAEAFHEVGLDSKSIDLLQQAASKIARLLHPNCAVSSANQMVDYVLSKRKKDVPALPIEKETKP